MIPPTEMAAALWQILRSGRANDDIAFTVGQFAGRNRALGLPRLLAGRGAARVSAGAPGLRAAAVGVLRGAGLYLLSGADRGVRRWAHGAHRHGRDVRHRGDDRQHDDRARPRAAGDLADGRGHALWADPPAALAAPSGGRAALVTGIKLAVAYSVIGIVAGEFILATAGIGKRIAFGYQDFDNRTMYGMLLLLLIMVMAVNGALSRWEKRLHHRFGQQ